jgi:hypothetical protein
MIIPGRSLRKSKYMKALPSFGVDKTTMKQNNLN